MSKSFLRSLISIFALFSLSVAFQSSYAAKAQEFRQGVLWEISKPGQPVSYLLGTMHSEDPRIVKDIPTPILTALNQSQSFSGELDMSIGNMMKGANAIYLDKDQPLLGIIGQARYDKCVEIFKPWGYTAETISNMKPWALAVMMSMPKPRTGVFLDFILYQKAKSQGLKLYGLETVEEQINIFDKLSFETQIIFLDESMNNYGKVDELIEEMTNLYLKQNIGGLMDFSLQEMNSGSKVLANLFINDLLINRNKLMVERMQPRLQEGNAFIAVGALHLPGEEGILNLLSLRGYTLKAVY